MQRVEEANTDRVAVVTGGARGIGAAVARRLANDGFAIAVADLEEDACETLAAGLRATGAAAIGVKVDVTDEAAVSAAVATVADVLGPPTVLVNNAGITRDNLLFKMSVAEWDSVQAVHLRGVFLMTREVQSHMVAAGFGRVVNISSVSALGNRGQANYSAAKAGIQGFTKTVALELGRFGVTSNAVAPGFVETEMTRATAERLKMSYEAFVAASTAQIAVGRVGQPADIAHAVAFLAHANSGFVTGQTLYVSGNPGF